MTASQLDPGLARTLWHRIETVNAVTYFSPECLDALADTGMQGFWMGYFAARASPLGAVGPGVVEATFVNFHPERVGRALPDAWERATPDAVVDVRRVAAAAALRRLLGASEAERLAASVVPALRVAAHGAAPTARPLFAANRDLPTPDDPVEHLWQLCTTLREHRGDGHVALLAGAGLDGCEVLVLFAAGNATDPALFQRSRGWSEDEWGAATDRLQRRGLLAGASLTDEGAALCASVERRTDELAVAAYAPLGDRVLRSLIETLSPPAVEITVSGEISFPNPMGLPPVESTASPDPAPA